MAITTEKTIELTETDVKKAGSSATAVAPTETGSQLERVTVSGGMHGATTTDADDADALITGAQVSADEVAASLDVAKKKRRERRSELADIEWRRYQKNKCPKARKNLLDLYVPLVRSVAGRMAMGFPRSVELQDLISTGVIGLVEAFKNFDPERGVKFETYAVPRIRGAILDELRALDWVPRSTRSKARSIDRARTALENDFGRPPTQDELAELLEFTPSELLAALDDVHSATVLSLDEVIYRDEDNRQVARIEAVEDKSDTSVLNQVLKDELRVYLRVSIGNLTEQEKLVIALYYFEELTLKEIGAVMKISESRVSQIHTKAVSKLRGMIHERFASA
ncbi:FliA/WhiG family RNA polymerase sigma factor [Gemmatimonas aurantiaca]|nr:FliA/WhiG family RNA polymerase sigma factor [Gemmatimonas aurantiaca]